MLDEPDRVPGQSAQVLSPVDFFALSDHSQDPSLLGDDWGLATREIDTIAKGGFQFYNIEWFAKELIPFTTGDKTGARPTFVARYDAALAARGVLREMKVLRKLSSGVFRPFCIAVPRHKLRFDQATREEFIAYRNEFLRVLKAKRGFNQREVQLLENQEAELRSLWDAQDAHADRRPTGDREVSAQPVFGSDDSDDGTTENPMARALQIVSETNEAAPAESEGGVEPSKSSTPVSGQEQRRDLGTALGGTEGFATEDE